jgi:hypothetical protein
MSGRYPRIDLDGGAKALIWKIRFGHTGIGATYSWRRKSNCECVPKIATAGGNRALEKHEFTCEDVGIE